MRVFRALWLTGLLLWAVQAGAQDLRPVPPLSARVIDQTATLTPPQQAALEAKLAAFEAESGPQIVVLLVPGTAPEDIAAYAQRVADQWKIGRREVGDGLLLVVAKDERTLRIEVAKALEGAVPDLAARQIIDQTLVPALRNNDYAGGLNLALDRLMARIRGEGLAAPAPRGGGGGTGAPGGPPLQEIGLMVFVGVLALGGLLSAVLGRGPGSLLTAVAAGGVAWWLGAGLLLAVLAALVALVVVGVVGVGNVLRLLLMARGGGGGGGGRGGGGFSSGGGGDFGGGGASGRW